MAQATSSARPAGEPKASAASKSEQGAESFAGGQQRIVRGLAGTGGVAIGRRDQLGEPAVHMHP